jgi:23S rRNA (cytidine1920-2'-O)/16S rRNA (cytidine1409-2'-O)-methyltransferase
VLKPGALVRPDAALAAESGAFPYVSRGGLKLAAALDVFGFSPEGRVALDLGASTGGFKPSARQGDDAIEPH